MFSWWILQAIQVLCPLKKTKKKKKKEKKNKERVWGQTISGPTLIVHVGGQMDLLKAPYSSKIDILLSENGLINWYMVLIES